MQFLLQRGVEPRRAHVLSRTCGGSVGRALSQEWEDLETERRRAKQLAFNADRGITPETVRKNIAEPIGQVCEADYVTVVPDESWEFDSPEKLARLLRKLRKDMERAAKALDFERAAETRDRILALERIELKAR